MKRALLVLLAILIMAGSIACSEPAVGDTSSTEAASSKTESAPADVSAAEESSEEENNYLVPHLGDADYTGKVLRILTAWDHMAYCVDQFGSYETTDEPVHDAFVERNRQLKAAYGFDIEAIFTDGWDAFTEKVRTDVLGDTAADAYDVIAMGLYYLTPLASEGLLYDLYSIEDSHFNFEGEWWDKKVNNDITIDNSLFYTTGDIFVLDDEQTKVIFFNKDIVNESNLDNPYDLVRSGDWTIDKFHEMAKEVAHPGGDGKMDATDDDVWGLVGGVFMQYFFVLGCNCPISLKDDNDIPYLAMDSEATANAFIKAHDLITDKDHVAYTERYYAWNNPDAHLVVDNFYKGQSLFFVNTLEAVNSDNLRNSDIHYGILPFPKYNKEQDNYRNSAEPYSFFVLSIPISTQDLDFTTFALEAMAYTGRQYVTSTYYTQTLKNKRFDDDDSPEMLDLIMQSRLIDLSVVYNWDDSIQYYNQMAVREANTLSSFIESHRGAYEKALGATVEAIQANK